MPSSNKEGKSIIRDWVLEISNNINTVLDLGVGNGTYQRLFRRKNKILKHSKWIGVEVWKPYIEEYCLREQYDILLNEDIRYVDYDNLGKIDLVFVGDVLEHVTKDEAIRLISNLENISNTIIISIPIIHWEQGATNNNPFERHVKDDWSHEEMIDTFKNIKKSYFGKKIGVYLINCTDCN